MGEPEDTLQAAREAFAARDWAGARERYTAARQHAPLTAGDLFALADAAWWLGAVEESLAAAEDAYRQYLDGQRPRPAAMAAIHIAVNLLLRGDDVVGSGWISRAQRLVADEPDSPEAGYLRYLTGVEGALDAVGSALDPVVAAAREVAEVGRRHGDRNLVALGTLGEGRALVRRGEVDSGLALLDEAMVDVLDEDLDPAWAGNIYCHLMAACHELADVRRLVAWTDATTRWLEALPEAVLFTGICRVHRSQVMQTTGSWDQAEREAAQVCADLADIHVASAAEGHYQLGELARLRGDVGAAEEAYALAHRRGRDPQPGMALLRLAQGRTHDAAAAIRGALAGSDDALARAPLCAAQVEIALAAGDVDTAEQAQQEIEATAARYRSSGLEATARHTRGAVLLAQGATEEALAVLREAGQRWRRLGAPYDAARVGTLLARACAALGDTDTAERELDAAAATFDRLGARPDADHVAGLRGRTARPGGLSAREAEVLALVAAGHTNREIASELVISDKTVARHLSNIFTKLDLSSRTAAAAFAFEHGLADHARR